MLKKIKKNLIYLFRSYSFLRNTKLSRDEWGIICPYGIGDTYIVCALSKQFLAQHGGKYFTVIVKNAQRDIPTLFPGNIHRVIYYDNLNFAVDQKINNIRILLKKEAGFSLGVPFIGHPSHLFNGKFLHLLGLPGYNLLNLYRMIFRLPFDAPLLKPVIGSDVVESARRRIAMLDLPLNKTVILAPESNSCAMIRRDFWTRLAGRLHLKGWVVCTLVMNKSNHISGTRPITFPLSEAITISELAGWVISARSGLCDLLSSSMTRLSIIYKNQKCISGFLYDCYNMKKTGIMHHVEEYILSDDEYQEDSIIDSIIEGRDGLDAIK